MIRTILGVAALALVTSTAFAQSAFVERKLLSTDAARKIVDTCLAFAAERNVTVGVAVVDISGVLLDFHMMEGGGPTTSETAILKAKTAAHWRRDTTTLEETVMSGGNQASIWINDFPKGGGIPIMFDGEIAGAVGVGGPQYQDECAQAGIDAIMQDYEQQASAN
jgi:glc operon protein GlcG